MEIIGTLFFFGVALGGCLIFAVFIAMVLFAKAGGLFRLAERYPAPEQPAGLTATRQTVQIGPVRYPLCTTVVIGVAGLYVWPRPILSRYDPVMIPWEEVAGVEDARLYGQKATRLLIGTPPVTTITVGRRLYEDLRSFVPSDRQSA